MPSLSELVHRTRNGDSDAANQLYTELRPYVRQLAEYQTNGVGNMDASAITQETLFQVVKSIPEYRGSEDPQFKSWIRRILVNKVTDEMRKLKPVKSLDSSDSRGPQRNLVPDIASSPSHKVNRKQQRVLIGSALEQALKKLPEDQAQAVILRHIEGLSISEIATRLDRSDVATRQLVRRGIVKLGEFLPENAKENLP